MKIAQPLMESCDLVSADGPLLFNSYIQMQATRVCCRKPGSIRHWSAETAVVAISRLCSLTPVNLIRKGFVLKAKEGAKTARLSGADVLLCKSVHVKVTILGVGLRAQGIEIPA